MASHPDSSHWNDESLRATASTADEETVERLVRSSDRCGDGEEVFRMLEALASAGRWRPIWRHLTRLAQRLMDPSWLGLTPNWKKPPRIALEESRELGYEIVRVAALVASFTKPNWSHTHDGGPPPLSNGYEVAPNPLHIYVRTVWWCWPFGQDHIVALWGRDIERQRRRRKTADDPPILQASALWAAAWSGLHERGADLVDLGYTQLAGCSTSLTPQSGEEGESLYRLGALCPPLPVLGAFVPPSRLQAMRSRPSRSRPSPTRVAPGHPETGPLLSNHWPQTKSLADWRWDTPSSRAGDFPPVNARVTSIEPDNENERWIARGFATLGWLLVNLEGTLSRGASSWDIHMEPSKPENCFLEHTNRFLERYRESIQSQLDRELFRRLRAGDRTASNRGLG